MAWIRYFDMLEPNGGASTINYMMGSLSLIPEITEFTISGRNWLGSKSCIPIL